MHYNLFYFNPVYLIKDLNRPIAIPSQLDRWLISKTLLEVALWEFNVYNLICMLGCFIMIDSKK